MPFPSSQPVGHGSKCQCSTFGLFWNEVLATWQLTHQLHEANRVQVYLKIGRALPYKNVPPLQLISSILIYSGLSGLIKFDTYGMRTDFSMEVLELQDTGLEPVGTWSNIDGLNMSRESEVTTMANPINIMANKTFVVTLIENQVVPSKWLTFWNNFESNNCTVSSNRNTRVNWF